MSSHERRIRRGLAVPVALVLASPLGAQQPGSLTGQVRSEGRRLPVAGALVTLDIGRHTMTDPSSRPRPMSPRENGMRDDSRTLFGTFGGVFTPCTLTILGVIMFLRYGQVVGQAGLWTTLAILAAAKAITLLTTLSLSAIATNTRVKGGGAYYLISRSLGVEFGGAIGVVFFLAQAIAVAMYVIGFTEALVTVVR